MPFVYTFCSTLISCFFFFFNDTATTEIYTLSLHDALPIFFRQFFNIDMDLRRNGRAVDEQSSARPLDRKSTRLNSSHQIISYAVFCLKKKIQSMSHRRLVVIVQSL